MPVPRPPYEIDASTRTVTELLPSFIQSTCKPTRFKPATTSVWWTPELERQKKICMRDRRKSQRSTAENRIALRAVYDTSVRTYRKAITKAKHQSWLSTCAQAEMWDLPYRLCFNKLKSKPNVDYLVTPEGTLDNAAEVAGLLEAKFFPRDNPAMDTPSQPPTRTAAIVIAATYGTVRPPPLLTEDELATAVRPISNKRAPGIDGIPVVMLKRLHKHRRSLLHGLVETSINQAHFPDCLKQARVTVLHKPGKPRHELGSMRPISVLAALSKIIESVANRRL